MALTQKSVFYEQAVRIPLIMHVPWLPSEQVMLDGPISQVDLAPTLLELAGAPPRITFRASHGLGPCGMPRMERRPDWRTRSWSVGTIRITRAKKDAAWSLPTGGN